AALFDDQVVFDGLWLWTKGRLDAQGLMTWKICTDGANNTNCGSGAATDGDEDMALALVFACMKKIKGAWGAGAQGINYCANATPPGSGNATKWGSVVSKNYAIASTAQTIGCSKLVPDWVSYAGAAQSPGFDANFADWFFDASRFATRIAIDKAWYNTASAA